METRTSEDVVELIRSEIRRLAKQFPTQTRMVLGYLKGLSPKLYALFVEYLEGN